LEPALTLVKPPVKATFEMVMPLVGTPVGEPLS
jgi:hypothetical protein